MAGPRFISNKTSQHGLSHSEYTWEYEYYEFEPVSFEGLKAHKCKSYWEFSIILLTIFAKNPIFWELLLSFACACIKHIFY